MNNIINFLSQLGANSQSLTQDEIIELASEHQLNEQEIQAVLERDHQKIAELLNARTNVCGLLLPAEDDEDSEDDSSQEEEIAA
ncbi:MAG TPA: hypothetical protein VIM93_03265 [Kangiella sp.]